MKTIKLSDADVEVMVDDDWYDLLIKYDWQLSTRRGRSYARAYMGCVDGRPVMKLMHSLIVPSEPGYETHHKDNNTFNNQSDNLISLTRSQHGATRTKYKCNTTGFKGVTVRKERGTFRAQIRFQGRLIIIGTYKTAEEAARAYNTTARRLFGEHAELNDLEPNILDQYS